MTHSSTKTELIKEMTIAMKKLGADVELLSIVGSIGDTLDNEEALELLRAYNGKGTAFRRVVARMAEMPSGYVVYDPPVKGLPFLSVILMPDGTATATQFDTEGEASAFNKELAQAQKRPKH